MNSRFN